MAFCNNCGAQLEENAKFCPSCGTAQTEQAPAVLDTPVEPVTPMEPVTPVTPAAEIPVQEVAPAPAKASGSLNVAQLVWSIINLILCCTPLGIASLIFTVIAKDAPTAEEEAKKLKTAKTCNLIGTIGGGVFIILYIVFVVLVTMLGILGGTGTI